MSKGHNIQIRVSRTRVRAYLCKNCGTHNEVMGDGPVYPLCLECKEKDRFDLLRPEYDIVVSSRKITENHLE